MELIAMFVIASVIWGLFKLFLMIRNPAAYQRIKDNDAERRSRLIGGAGTAFKVARFFLKK